MKSIQIYLSKEHYKVLTMYRLESWSYIISEPIYILPDNIEKKELSSKIFNALESSCELSESEEDKYRLGNKELLKRMKESSFNKLYGSSKSCSVDLKDNLVTVTPQKYLGKGAGLEEEVGQALKLNYNGENKNEIVTEITRLLERLNNKC